MFPAKIDGTFLMAARVVGTINSQPSLAAALKLPQGAIDLLELRLDAFAHDPGKLLKAIPKLKAPLLITARHPKEGALEPLSASQRARLYEMFLPHAALLDTEVRSLSQLQPVLDKAQAAGVIIVASFHDFKTTPRTDRLQKLAATAKNAGADLFKVAAVAQTPADVGRLLGLFSSAKLPLSVMGMGKMGKASRLLFARAGSVLNYGFLDEKAQVSGQWAATVLKERIAEL
jgi:3-dehydroquinate dehydratase-1